MKSIIQMLWLSLIISCSSGMKKKLVNNTDEAIVVSDFSAAEIILASELLNNILDEKMMPLKCIPSLKEAELFINTLTPRLTKTMDELEASLDDDEKIMDLISNCQINCLCHFLEDLFKEHEVLLSKKQFQKIQKGLTQKEINRCLRYSQETFCHSELFETLDKEKKDFKLDP